jgi:MFS family permease
MISDEDLDTAVTAGIVSPAAAQALRAHAEARSAVPVADEERFRLVAGFNDIFVVIACALVLVPVAFMVGKWNATAGGLAVSITSWLLTEVFVRRRRMALPAIVLTSAFVLGVTVTVLSGSEGAGPWLFWPMASAALIAAWLHWRRFRVPIIVALVALVIALIAGSLLGQLAFEAVHGARPVNGAPAMPEWHTQQDRWLPAYRSTLMFVFGVALFALAMRFDASDRERRTQRADIGFWLHIVAAPLLVHPVFSLITHGQPTGSAPQALGVAAMYVVLGLVSLAVDRRALMVSSLGYLLFTLTRSINHGFLSIALPVGLALLVLSAYWSEARVFALRVAPPSLRRLVPQPPTGSIQARNYPASY